MIGEELMRRTTILVLLIVLIIGACTREEGRDEQREACDAAYAKLQALGCEEMMKELLARGCFESEIAPQDCDIDVLEPCAAEIAAFGEPLDGFLDRKCGPHGTKTIEWPKPDTAAIKAARVAAAEARAAALAEHKALAQKKLEQAREQAARPR